MKKKQMTERNVSVVNFENNKIPTIKEHNNREWITFGEKNDYPEYLINLFDRSAKHNAIVTGKVHYITGNGWKVNLKGLTVEQSAKASYWIDNINSYDSCDTILSKVATDIELFDGCYLEVIPNKMGTGISEINHIGFEKIRISKNKDGYYYSKDWNSYKQTSESTGLKFLPPYDPRKFSGLYRYSRYRPGARVYPLPEYIGCIPYIEIDFEISNFHLNNIKNGFVGGTMISFNNGTPTNEEQKIIEQKIKNKFTGTDKSGQLIITFSENKDSAPTITPLLPNQFDKMFDQLNNTVMQEIFTGHKITSLSLFGIKESKGLGSKDELRQAWELFQNSYVTPKQNIIENIFNYFAEAMGYGNPLSIVPIEPIQDSLPQSEIIKVMTTDEIREKAGLPPLNNQEVIKASSHFHSVDRFKNIGKSKSEFKIISSKEVESKNEVLLSEISFYKQKFIDIEITHKLILDLIEGNLNIKVDDIAKAIKISKLEVESTISTMKELKLIEGTIGNLSILPDGKIVIDNSNVVAGVDILYSYEERKNLPPLISESRDFCKELIDLNKLYTRAEIESISISENRDVWATRGGYFHNTKFDQTTPYCRHVWVQNIVKKI